MKAKHGDNLNLGDFDIVDGRPASKQGWRQAPVAAAPKPKRDRRQMSLFSKAKDNALGFRKFAFRHRNKSQRINENPEGFLSMLRQMAGGMFGRDAMPRPVGQNRYGASEMARKAMVGVAKDFRPKPIYNKHYWVLGSCNNCGGLNYVEPHGTTAACKNCKTETEHSNIPHDNRDRITGTRMVTPLKKQANDTRMRMHQALDAMMNGDKLGWGLGDASGATKPMFGKDANNADTEHRYHLQVRNGNSWQHVHSANSVGALKQHAPNMSVEYRVKDTHRGTIRPLDVYISGATIGKYARKDSKRERLHRALDAMM
jgi:hypothetical protein